MIKRKQTAKFEKKQEEQPNRWTIQKQLAQIKLRRKKRKMIEEKT